MSFLSEHIDELDELAHSLAEEFAESVLSTNCRVQQEPGKPAYLDTHAADCNVTDHLRFLQLVGRIQPHPELPHLVLILPVAAGYQAL